MVYISNHTQQGDTKLLAYTIYVTPLVLFHNILYAKSYKVIKYSNNFFYCTRQCIMYCTKLCIIMYCIVELGTVWNLFLLGRGELFHTFIRLTEERLRNPPTITTQTDINEVRKLFYFIRINNVLFLD